MRGDPQQRQSWIFLLSRLVRSLISFKQLNTLNNIIEMDVLKSDENKTLEDEEIDEVTPLCLETELTDEGDETIKYQFIDFKSNDNHLYLQMFRRESAASSKVLMFFFD